MRQFVLCLLWASAAFAAEVIVVEEIVAKVNGDIITRSDLEEARTQLREAMRQAGLSGDTMQKEFTTRDQWILRDKIDDLLLEQKGRELNINVETEVSRQLADLQLKANIPDQAKFQEFVRQQTGMAFEDYRAEMRNYFLRDRVVRQEVASRISVPRAEIQKYYDEHKNEFVREERIFLREIFLSNEGKDAAGIAEVEKRARDLVARARKGEKFEDLVRDNSENQASRESGGLLAPAGRNDLRENIATAVWDKERNHVTDPINLGNGFVILKVEQQHRAGLASLEEVEGDIMQALFAPRFDPKIREYLTQLRQDAFLEIKPGYVDTAAAPGKNTRWTDPAELRPETVTREEVAAEIHRKRLLFFLPIPGTNVEARSISR